MRILACLAVAPLPNVERAGKAAALGVLWAQLRASRTGARSVGCVADVWQDWHPATTFPVQADLVTAGLNRSFTDYAFISKQVLWGRGEAVQACQHAGPAAAMPTVCWAQELMTRMFIVNIPLIFGAMWRVASMIIDDRVKAKIRFLKKSEMGQLYEFIDRDQLPTSLGGTREGCLSTHTGAP